MSTNKSQQIDKGINVHAAHKAIVQGMLFATFSCRLILPIYLRVLINFANVLALI